MERFYYLLLNFACLLVPFIASFYPKHAFYREWRYFFPANIVVAILFIIWDEVFTAHGIWGFNPRYLTGIYLGNLPLEEVLFFVCIPYCCTFTYFAFTYLFKSHFLQGKDRIISAVLIAILTPIGIFSFGKWYTFATCMLMSAYLAVAWWRKLDLSLFYLSFCACLVFFFLSNGFLTGSFTDEPIVWYNNAHNLGIRMGTIPVEDTFYGMLLLALNIDLYTIFSKKMNKSHS